MLVEDVLLIAFLLFVGLIGLPVGLGRRVFWMPRKDHALERLRVARQKLELLRYERDALDAERRYAEAVDEMLNEKEPEKKRGN